MSRSTSTNSRRAACTRPVRSISPSARPTRRRRSPFSRVSRSSTPSASPSIGFSQGGDVALGARRLAAARRAPARRRRLLPALRQPSGRDADGSDPHPGRRGRFGDAGRGLSAFVAAQPPGVARLVVLPGAGHLFDDPASAGGRVVLGMHFAYDRAAAARAEQELRRFLAETLSQTARAAIDAGARLRETCGAPRRSRAARFIVFSPWIWPTGPLDCGPRAGRCGGRHAETRIPHRRGGDAGVSGARRSAEPVPARPVAAAEFARRLHRLDAGASRRGPGHPRPPLGPLSRSAQVQRPVDAG